MAEARDSMDRLHALVERFYEEMSNRVRALEVVDIQNGGDADITSVDDTNSIATIRIHPPDVRDEATTDRQTVRFDFLHDLQQSRVYRRNQAFRRSVFSALTNSVCSVGWSLFSEMSLSEVSNISVINLPITDRETFNPQRSSQTWSAKLNEGASAGPYINDLRDNQRTQLNKIARKPVPATNSAMVPGHWLASAQTEKQNSFATRPSSRYRALEGYDVLFQSVEHYKEEMPVRMTEEHATKITQPPKDDLNPLSTSKDQPVLLSQSDYTIASNFLRSLRRSFARRGGRVNGFSSTKLTRLSPLSDWTDNVTYPCKSCEERLKEADIFILGDSSIFLMFQISLS